MESCFLPFSLDVREGWKTQPYSKEGASLCPFHGFVITSISNHLNTEHKEMCLQAIGEIYNTVRMRSMLRLVRCGIKKRSKAFLLWRGYGVDFLGSRKHPSQIAGSVDCISMNFPLGSGTSLLESRWQRALLVVSMYR